MPQFTTRRSVRHSADDMFDLFADVEKYPQFVPLCQALRVRKRTPAALLETGETSLRAVAVHSVQLSMAADAREVLERLEAARTNR